MSGAASDRKSAYFVKLLSLLDKYPAMLLISSMNVGSALIQSVRRAIRPFDAVILMGKNTLMRKAVKGHIAANPKLEALMPHLVGNVGLIFCKEGTLSDVRNVLKQFREGAFAKQGAVAPDDVIVPAGPTGLEPTQTSFLQALNIPTKIVKGQVEIVKDIDLIKKGNRVTASEAALCTKLGIKPFSYGLEVKVVYDNGTTYDQKVLEMSDSDILNKFTAGVKNIAALGLQIGYPTLASIPHSVANTYKRVVSVGLATDVSFKQIDKLVEMIKNPGKFAAAKPAAAASAAPAAKAAAPAAKVEEKKKEEEEEDMGGMGGLFD